MEYLDSIATYIQIIGSEKNANLFNVCVAFFFSLISYSLNMCASRSQRKEQCTSLLWFWEMVLAVAS